MNNHQHMREFIKRVSGQDSILTVPKIYIELTDDLNAALLLNQMIFYSSITKRKDGFFYKTYKEWEEEIFLTQYQVKKATDHLKEMNIVETKLKKANGSPTLHYKVDMEHLENSIIKKLDNPLSKNLINDYQKTSYSLTENYTENYTSSSSAFAFYEQNMGVINPFVAENIEQWINDLNEELVIESMKIALKANKRFNYAEGILKDWYKKNVRTLDDLKTDKPRRKVARF